MSEVKIDNYEGKYNLTTKKNREIKYVVIHYTAGTSSAKGKALATAKYFNKATTKASADFIVDDETIVQYNQDLLNQYTWHCGGSKLKTKGGNLYGNCTNANSIGIELCSTNKNKKVEKANDKSWYFTQEVFCNAVNLVHSLIKDLREQGIEIPLENVIRHYEVTGKLCPGIIGWNADSGDEIEWEKFKQYLELSFNEDEKPENWKDMFLECNKELVSVKNENERLKLENAELKNKLYRISELAKT